MQRITWSATLPWKLCLHGASHPSRIAGSNGSAMLVTYRAWVHKPIWHGWSQPIEGTHPKPKMVEIWIWLVVWNIFYFHNIWDNPSHWLICFRGMLAEIFHPEDTIKISIDRKKCLISVWNNGALDAASVFPQPKNWRLGEEVTFRRVEYSLSIPKLDNVNLGLINPKLLFGGYSHN